MAEEPVAPNGGGTPVPPATPEEPEVAEAVDTAEAVDAATPVDPAKPITCPHCGAHLAAGAHFCTSCGTKIDGQAAPYTAPASPTPGPAVQAAPVAGEQPKDTAPLVLGILSIVLSGIVGLVLGILALSKGKKALEKYPNSGKAKAGRICGIVGTVLSAIATVCFIIVLATGMSIGGLLGDPSEQTGKAADKAIESVVNPSDSEKQELADSIDSSLSSLGFPSEDIGVSAQTVTNWLFKDVKYTRDDVELNDDADEATVTYTVTSHDMYSWVQELYNADTSGINMNTDEASIKNAIAGLISDTLKSTEPSEKTVTIDVTKESGTWTVDPSEIESAAQTIYLGEEDLGVG